MQRRLSLAAALVASTLSLGFLVGCEQVPGPTNQQDLLHPAAQTGSLKVRLTGDFSALRSVQATVSDIDRVAIRVTMPGLVDRTQTLTRDDLANSGSVASTTFESIPAGTAEVSVTIFDVYDIKIGEASTSAEIVAFETTNVSLTVQLDPTYVLVEGSVAATINLVNGPVIQLTPVPAKTVATVAGGGADYVEGHGSVARFRGPVGVTVDPLGNLFVADTYNHRIRKVSRVGYVTPFAGNGTSGFADGSTSEAKFMQPAGITIDATGNLYVADTGNHRIRKVTPEGVVSTIAGNGNFGFADGPGASAEFRSPTAIAVDKNGNLYVTDRQNHRIRKITPEGVVSTFAGIGEASFADGAANVAKFYSPQGITIDKSGNLYVADQFNHRIRKISPTGSVSTYAGDGTADFADGLATSARFNGPTGIAIDQDGNLYVADTSNNRIRKIEPGVLVPTVSTYAGTGTEGFLDGPKASALFKTPMSMTIDLDGNLYVSDSGTARIRKITP